MLTTVLTLVPPSSFRVTVGTGPLYIAVRQEALTGRTVRQEHSIFVNVTLPVEGEEKILGDLSMVLGARCGEEIEGDAKLIPAAEELLVKTRCYLLRGFPFLIGPDGDRGTMLVAAGNHEHLIALKAMIAGKDIRREIGSCYMSQMQGAVGIRPSYTDKDSLCHGFALVGNSNTSLCEKAKSSNHP